MMRHNPKEFIKLSESKRARFVITLVMWSIALMLVQVAFSSDSNIIAEKIGLTCLAFALVTMSGTVAEAIQIAKPKR